MNFPLAFLQRVEQDQIGGLAEAPSGSAVPLPASDKELDSVDAAKAYADKKIAEKTKDGYVEK